MASPGYPLPSWIAFGDIDKLRRAALPSLMMARTLSNSFTFSQLADSTRAFKDVRGAAESARGLSPLLDSARYMSKVVPTAAIERSFIFPESMRPTALTGTSVGGLAVAPTFGRDIARVSEMVNQVMRPGSDSLRLLRDYQSVMAATARAAEAYVVEDVLPEVVGPDSVPERGLAGQARDWWDELPAPKRRLLASYLAGVLLSVERVIGAASERDAHDLVVALAGYWLAIYAIYCLVADERERRAGR